mgnify:CR=1 FL=1
MSKGGSTTSKTEIPAWLENAAIENINKARNVSQLGYTPYYGPDVAAFSPMQQQSMQSTGNAASAFGLAPQGFDAMAGMPQAQTFAGGVQGYSSAPLYQQALDQLQANRPGQYQAMTDMFIDPFTGAPAQGSYNATPAQVDQMFDRTPANQPDYAININNSSAGDTGAYVDPGMSATDTIGGVNYPNTPPPGMVAGSGGLMSNTDAAAGVAGNLLDSSIYGQIYEGITGNPLAGGSPDAIVSELSNEDLKPPVVGTSNDSAVDYSTIPTGGAGGPAGQYPPPPPASDWGYDDDYSDPNLWDFSAAASPAPEVVTAVPDTTFPMGAKEDLSLSATVTPYSDSAVEVSTGLLDMKESENALQAEAARLDAETKKEAAAAKKKADNLAAAKARQAADAKAAKTRAKAEAKKKADYQAEQKSKADAKAKAEAAVQRQLDAEKRAKAKEAAERKAKAKTRAERDAKANAEAKRIADALEKQTNELAAKKIADAAKKKAQIEAATKAKEAQARKAAAEKRAKAQAAKEAAEAAKKEAARKAQAAADRESAARAMAKATAKAKEKYNSSGRKGYKFGL